MLIAKALGYNEDECENLKKAALLHDIGKIGIPIILALSGISSPLRPYI